MQSLKQSITNEKLPEEEKLSEFISKSFYIEREKPNKNNEIKNGNSSFFADNIESKNYIGKEANKNIAQMTIKETELSFGENKTINDLNNIEYVYDIIVVNLNRKLELINIIQLTLLE